ncbi:glycosyltransferase family 9 protein [candidate division KSB1 bacterium]|nr:glycosyltransferase family 9 protein [candidate division KSB1 bacterium]
MDQIPSKEHNRIQNILIIGSIGIGNLLLFSSTLRRIRRRFPEARITIIVLKEGFREIFKSDPSIDEIIVLDVKKVKTFSQKITFLKDLRKTDYQLCITTFPANRLEYNALAFFSGAKWRVSHKYNSKKIRSLSFLQNVRIPVDKKLHDLEQNLNLLKAFGLKPEAVDHELYLSLDEKAHDNANRYLKQKTEAGEQFIGIHPGSSVERGMILKRWSIEKFAEICTWLTGETNAKILLFGGQDEEGLRKDIAEKADGKPLVVTGLDFQSTASLIGKCMLFISNDSGLMHVAVSMGVPTAALFGPSDPGRTAPYGAKHKVIRTGIECSPCWSINNLGAGSVNCIHPENLCMTQLSLEIVKNDVGSMLKKLFRE